MRLSLENCRSFTLKGKSKELLGSEVRFKKNILMEETCACWHIEESDPAVRGKLLTEGEKGDFRNNILK